MVIDPLTSLGITRHLAKKLSKEKMASMTDRQTCRVIASEKTVYAAVRRFFDSPNGYPAQVLWSLRRRAEELINKNPRGKLWRVVENEPDRLFVIQTELRVPGKAWVRYEIEPSAGATRLTQIEIFEPSSWMGKAYWYAVYVPHRLVFIEMLREIKVAAERNAEIC